MIMSEFKTYLGLKNFIDTYRMVNGEKSISDSFIISMCKGLDEDFYKKTGIRMSKSKGKVNFGPFNISELRYIIDGYIGTFNGNIGIEALIVGYDIKWRSKQEGKIIYPQDEIEESEVEFWFDRVFEKTAKEKWFKIPPKLGINLKPLSYQLNVESFTEHFYLVITFKVHNEQLVKEVEKLLNEKIERWNELSSVKDGKYGYVHDRETHKLMPNLLIFYIDGGSSSIVFLKLVFEALSDTQYIEKVTITSYPDED